MYTFLNTFKITFLLIEHFYHYVFKTCEKCYSLNVEVFKNVAQKLLEKYSFDPSLQLIFG